MKYQFSAILAILIMVFAPISLSGALIADENQSNISLTFSEPFEPSSSQLDIASEPIDYFTGEVVIFVDNYEEYYTLTDHPAFVQGYRNLKAVKLDPSESQFDLLATNYDQLLPAGIFIQPMQFPVASDLDQEVSTIELDGIADVSSIGVEGMWDLGYKGDGITVAVIDNGVDFNHDALGNDAKAGEVTATLEGVTPCQDHGTPVAGSVAAREGVPGFENAVGTAPLSKIFSIEAGCGEGGALYLDSLSAWNTIFANNATIDVVNTSYGGPPNIVYNNFVQQAEDLGIIVVGAAGNDGGPRNMEGGPGNTVWGLSVGASTYSNGRAVFTSVGPGYNFNQKPDVIAPGSGVTAIQTGNEIVQIDGTSFASPTTAGGVATLIQALKANAIDYNVGVLKAGVMRGANPILNSRNIEGFGLVNITNSFELIQSLTTGSDGVPEIVEISPKSGPVGIIDTIPQGSVFEATYTLITSHPNDTVIEFGGGLAGIASLSQSLVDDNSQFLKISIDTTSLSPDTTLTGTITATNGGDSVTANFSIKIGGPFKGKVAFDMLHTSWDLTDSDRIDGSNTGEMVRLAFQNGWIVEEIDERITPSLLSNYDILWMPDPFGAVDSSDLNINLFGQTLSAEKYIWQSEIDAIHDFVGNGGNLLLDFNGILESDGDLLANATATNALLSEFGITAVEEAIPTPSGASNLPVSNKTSLVRGLPKITHFGNYLETTGGAIPFTKDSRGRISGAIFTDDTSGGRVLATSSNFWMDNFGATGRYTSDGQGQENDRILSDRVWKWFGQETKIAKVSEVATTSQLTGEFVILDGDTPSTTGTPVVTLRENKLVTEQTLTPTSLGNGRYSFTYDITQDGIYEVEVSYGDDYIAFTDVTLDTTSPVFSFEDGQTNSTTYNQGSSYFIEFTITDAISVLSKPQINTSFNGELFTDTEEFYSSETGEYRLLFDGDLIPAPVEGQAYYLDVSVIDDYDNMAAMVYEFFITPESDEPDEPDDDPTPTTSEDSPLSWFWSLIALFSMVTVMIRRRYT